MAFLLRRRAVIAAGPVALRPGVVEQDVRRCVVGDVGAAPEAVGAVLLVEGCEIQRAGGAGVGAGIAVIGVAAEAADLGAFLEVVELEPPRAAGHGQHLRDDVEIGGAEDGVLLVAAREVVEEPGVGARRARVVQRGAGQGRDRHEAGCGEVVEIRAVADLEILVVETADTAQAPRVGRAEPYLLAEMGVVLGIDPGGAWRVALRVAGTFRLVGALALVVVGVKAARIIGVVLNLLRVGVSGRRRYRRCSASRRGR